MLSPILNLLVLRFLNLDTAASFYSSLGFILVQEQHGSGPIHYSIQSGQMVLELYPLQSAEEHVWPLMLGFNVPSIEAAAFAAIANGGSVLVTPKLTERGLRAVIVDPGGHKLELIEKAT